MVGIKQFWLQSLPLCCCGANPSTGEKILPFCSIPWTTILYKQTATSFPLMESGPYQWCQKGSIEPMPKEQMVSAHFLRIQMTTSQQSIGLDMETQKLHYNCLTEMCTEADLVSRSWWVQHNMFIAQSVFFSFLVHCQWLSFPLT